MNNCSFEYKFGNVGSAFFWPEIFGSAFLSTLKVNSLRNLDI